MSVLLLPPGARLHVDISVILGQEREEQIQETADISV
jgi:hypothetical protein